MTSSSSVTGYIFCTTHLPIFLRWQNDPHRWRLQRRKGSNVMRVSPQGGMSWFLPEWRLAGALWHPYHLCAIRSNCRDPLYIIPYVSVVLKQKCHHYNFRCSQRWKFRRNDDIPVLACAFASQFPLYFVFIKVTLSERHCVSKRRQLHCLFNRLTKKTSKLCVTEPVTVAILSTLWKLFQCLKPPHRIIFIKRLVIYHLNIEPVTLGMR